MPSSSLMPQVGNVGLTVTESRSHFALWCFLAAPLLIGTDLHTASNETIAILGAAELIKVDQDPLVRKTPLFVGGIFKRADHSPRQARDKHKETLKTKGVFFRRASKGGLSKTPPLISMAKIFCRLVW